MWPFPLTNPSNPAQPHWVSVNGQGCIGWVKWEVSEKFYSFERGRSCRMYWPESIWPLTSWWKWNVTWLTIHNCRYNSVAGHFDLKVIVNCLQHQLMKHLGQNVCVASHLGTWRSVLTVRAMTIQCQLPTHNNCKTIDREQQLNAHWYAIICLPAGVSCSNWCPPWQVVWLPPMSWVWFHHQHWTEWCLGSWRRRLAAERERERERSGTVMPILITTVVCCSDVRTCNTGHTTSPLLENIRILDWFISPPTTQCTLYSLHRHPPPSCTHLQR